MTSITFNPENWIDDEATMVVDGNTVEINGETLTLDHKPVELDEDGNSKWDFYAIHVMWEGQKLVTLSRFGNDKEWELLGASIERNHADPIVLAGIAASNLI